MESTRFDRIARRLSAAGTRRRTLGALALGALGLASIHRSAPVSAGEHPHKNKKRKLRRNRFGCVNVGQRCQTNGQCCSGICQGKQGQQRCKGHDSGGCAAGQKITICGGSDEACTTTTGLAGACQTTTGNAGFCRAEDLIFDCNRDADCQELFGDPAAACVVCEGVGNGRLCAGPG